VHDGDAANTAHVGASFLVTGVVVPVGHAIKCEREAHITAFLPRTCQECFHDAPTPAAPRRRAGGAPTREAGLGSGREGCSWCDMGMLPAASCGDSARGSSRSSVVRVCSEQDGYPHRFPMTYQLWQLSDRGASCSCIRRA
jgi:hypothetical protein